MNGRPGRRIGAEVLRLALAKVVAPLEALRVELVDIFGAPRDAPRISGQAHLADLSGSA
jgi:hypothetical protein